MLELVGDEEYRISQDIEAESNRVSSDDEEIATFESANSYDMRPLVWDVTFDKEDKVYESITWAEK